MERCPSSFQHFVYLLRGLARGAGSSKSGMSRLALTEKFSEKQILFLNNINQKTAARHHLA